MFLRLGLRVLIGKSKFSNSRPPPAVHAFPPVAAGSTTIYYCCSRTYCNPSGVRTPTRPLSLLWLLSFCLSPTELVRDCVLVTTMSIVDDFGFLPASYWTWPLSRPSSTISMFIPLAPAWVRPLGWTQSSCGLPYVGCNFSNSAHPYFRLISCGFMSVRKWSDVRQIKWYTNVSGCGCFQLDWIENSMSRWVVSGHVTWCRLRFTLYYPCPLADCASDPTLPVES
jgi:hypothetical protein